MAEGASVPGGWFTITVLLVLLGSSRSWSPSASRGAPCAPTAAATPPLFGTHESDRRRASGRRRTVCGPRRLGGGHPTPTARRRPAARGDRQCSTRCPDAPPPNSRATPAPPFPAWRANCAPPQMAFNDVTYGERPGTEAGYRIDRRSRRPPASTRAVGARPPRPHRSRDAGLGGDPMTPPPRPSARRSGSAGAPSGGCCWRWSAIIGGVRASPPI